MNQISPKVQNQINMLQQLQQQIQTLLTQKNQYQMAAQEGRRAIEELEDVTDDAAVYMSVGTVMVQKSKDSVVGKLTETVENHEVRIKSIEKQEKMFQDKFEKLQNEIKHAMEGKTPEAA